MRRVLTFTLLLGASFGFAQSFRTTAVNAVDVTVSDLDRSVAFYSSVLHFQKLSEDEIAGEPLEHATGVFGARIRTALLQLGGEHLRLTEYLAPQGRPISVDSRSNDLWFQHIAIVVSDMDRAYQWLRDHRVQHASSGPQTLPQWNKNAGGIKAFYFRDPDNHNLEIIYFPPGKGDPKWQRTTASIFMGIDHTAIAVADTERSLAFYRDLLGFHVAGSSENYGTEQEHLNNVFGARLRITSLRAMSGPGVELLEYLAPRTGRSIPDDLHANDIAHWETEILTTNVRDAFASLAKTSHPLISSDVEPLTFSDETREEFLAKDPDGHVVSLMSPQRIVTAGRQP